MAEHKDFRLPSRVSRQSMAPVAHEVHSFELETSFLEPPVHHRWLLTTCIAGAAVTLVAGGITLGLFGHNAAPRDANAAVNPVERSQTTGSTSAAAKAEVVPERDLSGDWGAYPEITQDELPYSDSDVSAIDTDVGGDVPDPENVTEISKTPPPEPVDETFVLAKGSTLVDELTGRGVSKAAALELAHAIEPALQSRPIKAGTEFEVTFDRQIDFYGREVIFPVELSFKLNDDETIEVSADEDGNFEVHANGKKPVAPPSAPVASNYRAQSKIGPSLYATAKDDKIPEYIISEFTRVFSYDVDFQHQINGNDSFDIFFGKPLTGTSSKRKVLHYAALTFGGVTKRYYRFTSSDGQTDYYDEDGRSASRALLKTPVSGYKLTSGFGMRRHPILGYSKMHTGVDFGAPTGTPIRAAGNGIIDLAGRHGAYGNTIVIKHNDKYKTLYAHMSRLAAGIRRGTRVNQGQIIGYVGTTGRSTGPHLHYEVRVKDRPVNPTTIRALGGKQLAGKDMQNFRVLQQRVLAMIKTAPSSTQLADSGQ